MAPSPGFITNINNKQGNLTIQYNMAPIVIESPLAGRVIGTDSSKTVSMECSGLKLQGVLGFGKTVRGPLKPLGVASRKGDIAFTGSSVDSSILETAWKAEVSGLVCPSISANALVSWLGREPGIFHTGQEDIPFSLLILHGIGRNDMDPVVLESLSSSSSAGINTAFFPETKICAGILRPFLVISSD